MKKSQHHIRKKADQETRLQLPPPRRRMKRYRYQSLHDAITTSSHLGPQPRHRQREPSPQRADRCKHPSTARMIIEIEKEDMTEQFMWQPPYRRDIRLGIRHLLLQNQLFASQIPYSALSLDDNLSQGILHGCNLFRKRQKLLLLGLELSASISDSCVCRWLRIIGQVCGRRHGE